MHKLIAELAGAAAHGDVYDDTVGWFIRLLFTFVACPLTILALALDEQLLGGRYRRLSPLGDISYSTYLIHIPLQMALALMALALGIRSHVFMSPFAMMAFFGVLIALGTLSFRCFERPMQKYMRSWRRPRVATAPTPS